MDGLEEIRIRIIEGDSVEELIEEALSSTPAVEILNSSLLPAMQTVGELWKDGSYFLPDVVLAADVFKDAMEVLRPRIAEGDSSTVGKFLIGVVRGDVHDLGKSIVISMLTSAGFEVIDLGINIPSEVFVEKVDEHRPDILGIGAYMSTTMLGMKDVVAALGQAGLRDKVKVMFGGVTITPGFALESGADSYGRDAIEAVENAKKLMGVSG